ncbi:hypothetical protein CR513_50945, partial [Mucuna pruriens]
MCLRKDMSDDTSFVIDIEIHRDKFFENIISIIREIFN